MALPTTALRLHLDASVSTNVWKFYQGTTPYHNTTPASGDAIQVWDDADGRNLSETFSGAGTEPTWVSTTPLMALPNVDFNGTVSFLSLTDKPGNNMNWDTVADPAAFVILFSLRIRGVSANDATPYLNDGIIVDPNGYLSVNVRNNAGAYTLYFYNYAGADASIPISVSLDTNYVVCYWHTGGSIYAEVYSGAGLVGSGNTASGSTGSLTGLVALGRSTAPNKYFNGKIGEVAIYDAYNATDKTNATDYFKTKWLVSAGPSLPTFTAITPNSAYANPTVPVKLVGVSFAGTGLDGTSGAFAPVTGFTFSNLSIAGGGASGTVDIQIATAQAAGAYNFTYVTAGGTSSGTSTPAVVFTINSPTGGTSGDTGGLTRLNAGLN